MTIRLVALFPDPTERLLGVLGKDARERAIDHVYRCGCRNRRLRYHAVVAVGKEWGDGNISTEEAVGRLYSLYAATGAKVQGRD